MRWVTVVMENWVRTVSFPFSILDTDFWILYPVFIIHRSLLNPFLFLLLPQTADCFFLFLLELLK